MNISRISLRFVGAFYALAGNAALRQALIAHVMDRALSVIALEKPKAAERAETLWLLCSALLVLAGGIALMLLLELAVWLFLASAVGQMLYIAWLAPRYLDGAGALDARGRQQNTNALAIYMAATAFVVWASYTGRLEAQQEVPPPLLALGGAAVAAHAGYAVWMYARPLAPGRGLWEEDAGGRSPGDDPRDPSTGD